MCGREWYFKDLRKVDMVDFWPKMETWIIKLVEGRGRVVNGAYSRYLLILYMKGFREIYYGMTCRI